MGLIVALDDNSQAAGELFWDDGDSRGIVCKRAGFVLNGIIRFLLLPVMTGALS